MKSAFYNIYKSYEKNYNDGPPINSENISQLKRTIKKKHKFLGFEVNLPFGIAAGPLLNSKFIKAAFDFGFDVSTYKTVRADIFPSHPYPNILYVDVPEKDLYPEKTPRLIGKSKTDKSKEEFSITNSFGVPSQPKEIWQEDVKKALGFAKDGQLMILSFMGTVKKDQTQNEFIDDFTLAGKLAFETGAKVLEANLSCPNIGNEGLVCYNLETTKKVCESLRKVIGNTPLILKVGHYKNDKDIEELAKIANEYANGIASINTLQVEVVDENGNQALPGDKRLRSGICGASIKWAGLNMVKKLNEIRQKENFKFEIVGIGGVMTPEDFLEYRAAGADLVQSATGAMWNHNLAHDIWKASESI